MEEKEIALSEYYIKDTDKKDAYVYEIDKRSTYSCDMDSAFHTSNVELVKAWMNVLKIMCIDKSEAVHYKIVVRETILKDYKGD